MPVCHFGDVCTVHERFTLILVAMQVATARDFMDKIYNAFWATDWQAQYPNLIDLVAAADFMLLEELAKDVDSYRYNTSPPPPPLHPTLPPP